MTRIVAGAWGGRTLQVPKSGTRPTSERVREAVFSRLDALGAVEDARVLDVFAGSGALGLEALSRGAASAVFVEIAGGSAKVIRANIAALGARGQTTVEVCDGARFVTGLGVSDRFDLVFLDPPYALASYVITEVLAGLTAHLAPEGLMVLETSKQYAAPEIPSGLMVSATKTYGDTLVNFLELAANQATSGGNAR